MERILQGVDTVQVDVSSVHAQSYLLVQFAVSAMVKLVRSRNRCVKNDVALTNALQNAGLAVVVVQSVQDLVLPDPINTSPTIITGLLDTDDCVKKILTSLTFRVPDLLTSLNSSKASNHLYFSQNIYTF